MLSKIILFFKKKNVCTWKFLFIYKNCIILEIIYYILFFYNNLYIYYIIYEIVGIKFVIILICLCRCYSNGSEQRVTRAPCPSAARNVSLVHTMMSARSTPNLQQSHTATTSPTATNNISTTSTATASIYTYLQNQKATDSTRSTSKVHHILSYIHFKKIYIFSS